MLDEERSSPPVMIAQEEQLLVREALELVFGFLAVRKYRVRA
jgi:hypothetical protein